MRNAAAAGAICRKWPRMAGCAAAATRWSMADAAEIVYVPADRGHRNRVIGLLTALAVLVLDQAVKWAVTYVFQLRERIEIKLHPYFRQSWTENRGDSMGIQAT